MAGVAHAADVDHSGWVTAKVAQATDADHSDLWWNADESGWGMQLVRGGDVMFATMFVYDANMRPTFFTATLSASGASWSGTLHETSGPSYAAPVFDASRVTLRVVGALTFTPVNAESAQLVYAVDGSTVSKAVTRQTLRLDNYSGSFPVMTQRVTTHCSDGTANGDRIVQESIAVAQDNNIMTVDWTSAARTCRHAGAFAQNGKLGSVQASYACSDAEFGDMQLFELTKHDGFISGRFQGHGISNGCDYRGRFSGFLPD